MVERKMVIAEALTEKFSHRLWKIKNVLTKLGEPKYQLKNTYLAIYQRRIFEWSKLSNLKKPVRDALRDAFGGDDDVLTVKLERDQNASQCTKSLLKLYFSFFYIMKTDNFSLNYYFNHLRDLRDLK